MGKVIIAEMVQNGTVIVTRFFSFSIRKPMKIVGIVEAEKMLPIGMNEPH